MENTNLENAATAAATTVGATTQNRVKWYRVPLDKETLAQLNAKSDAKGLAQSLGHLALIALTATATLYSASHGIWWGVLLGLFAHGTVCSFMINAVHELVHKCVFKTQWLNQFFVRIFGFIGWVHFEHFYASHMRHHQFTLHQPDDLEVVLPIKILTKNFFKYSFVSFGKPYMIFNSIRLAKGKFEGEWENKLFPADEPQKAEPIKRWARTLLIGHGVILLVSIIMAVIHTPVWLLVPVLFSFPSYYGTWLLFLCNNTQHIGLCDSVPDFRLCCRTFTVNPLTQFLYWHMNYHIEHHMYAAVPCYNLGKLHRAIKHELPPTPHGLIATWKEIAVIQRKQAEDPSFQYMPPLPNSNSPVPSTPAAEQSTSMLAGAA